MKTFTQYMENAENDTYKTTLNNIIGSLSSFRTSNFRGTDLDAEKAKSDAIKAIEQLMMSAKQDMSNQKWRQ